MDHFVVLSFLIVFAWVVIPTMFFFTLFLVVCGVFKATDNEVYYPRYASILTWSPIRGVWIGMSSFMEDQAFKRLENGPLKSLLTSIYPVYYLWDKTFLIAILVMIVLAGVMMFG